MKNMRNILIIGVIIAMIMPVLEGCKKGEEDPGISFRSRNSRVTGTWELKSYDVSSTNTATLKVTNDVNDDVYDRTIITTSSESYNGSSLTENDTYKEDWTRILMWYDVNQWEDQEITYKETSSTSTSESFSFTISLYTDNTYETTETSSNVSGTWAYDEDLDYDDSGDPASGAEYSDDDDGDWTTTGTSTDINQGSWYWEDNTKKNKLYLNAGWVRGRPLRGKVVKLSNKEMWIEIQYSQLGGNGENTSDIGSDTDVQEDVFNNDYKDSDQFSTSDDDETTVTTWNNTETHVMWVFEKIDKNSKRHKADGGE